ncbi:MAG: response regulator transcription factor [Bacteroidales bacterium]|nr:response regulator transcription factor [Bacteroidales bacterium]
MAASKKGVLLIVPSLIVARGLESVFNDLGEFKVVGVLSDFSHNSDTRLRNIEADIILMDPQVLDFETRKNGRSFIGEYLDVPVVALETSVMREDLLKQYDEVVNLYDEPTTIIKKLRSAMDAQQDSSKGESNDLSTREKEILVCVAKGMLNKEIADRFNLSIYTVITHRKNITRKTGIKTVAGLTVYALLNNLIDINSVE